MLERDAYPEDHDAEEEPEEDEEEPLDEADEENLRVQLPDPKNGELFGRVDRLVGGSRLHVVCEDGKGRMGRIRGKLKRRMWMREGDLVICRPWEFQNDKADILYRYTQTQVGYLIRQKILPSSLETS